MVAITPEVQVTPATAPVQLPDVALSVYRALVADLQAHTPDNRERIGRALDVLLGCAFYETEQGGVFLVQSCRDAGTYYRASGLHCTCVDHQRHPETTCKHSASVQILCSASGLASWERRQRGAPNPPPPPTCASCGRESELDTRGQCDLCAWCDAVTVFELTPAGQDYLERTASRVAQGA
jgi:hypothetical protein